MSHDDWDANLAEELRKLEHAIKPAPTASGPLLGPPVDATEARAIATAPFPFLKPLERSQTFRSSLEIDVAGPGFWGVLAAGGWTLAVVSATALSFGVEGLAAQGPGVLVGLAAAAIGPAVLIGFSATAMRHTKAIRAETLKLAALAEDALQSPEEAEGRARRLSGVVRSEIGAMHAVMQTALDRFVDLEAAATRNACVFETAVSCARDGAGILAETLQTERSAFESLSSELQIQSQTLAENVSRQIRMMREASRLLKGEYESADRTLHSHLNAFTAAASLMSERTDAITAAAVDTHSAANRLDNSVAVALESLSHASSLTDSARQSAENASLAANATASAVRDVTQKAVHDARKVAQLIRAETQAMEESAAATLAKLKSAADESRRAAEEAEAAADRQAASLQRRLAGLGRAPRRSVTPSLHSVDTSAESIAPGGVSIVANDHGPEENAYPKSLLVRAGLDAERIFAPEDLDYIATSARQGGQARRKAVASVAADAVALLKQVLQRDAEAGAEARALRADPIRATRTGSKEALVGYLLVDAALG
jgi:hypothetical protein